MFDKAALFVLGRMNSSAQRAEVNSCFQEVSLKCKYDFAVQGGAIGAINLKDENGGNATIPDNAIIQHVLIDVITAPTSGGSATLAIDAQSAGDLRTALAVASFTGILAGNPVDTAASAIKLTADRAVTLTVATAALTAGVFNVYVRYTLGD